MTSTAKTMGDFRLSQHESSLAQLRSVMSRVGARMDTEEFIEAVSVAFQDLQSENRSAGADGDFGRDTSFEQFRRALQVAREACDPVRSITVLGCARGFAGKTAEVAGTTVAEVFGGRESVRIETLDLSPALLREFSGISFVQEAAFSAQKHSCDLVVAHSVLHFVPDVNPFFDLIKWLLRKPGGLILAHEPNARFWENRYCLSAVDALRRDLSGGGLTKGLRNLLRPARMLSPFRKTKVGPENFWGTLNRMLAERHGFRDALADNEIRRIVDVHRPEAIPGDFRIGLNGFDADNLGSAYLPGFKLAWSASADHLGYNPRNMLSSRWQAKETELAREYPKDGSVFTAFWLQGEAR
jgi:SAM-dependent methyltransferase